MLDFFLFINSNLFVVLRGINIANPEKLKKSSLLHIIALSIIVIVIAIFFSSSSRDISLAVALAQRSGAYESFFQISLFDFLFGYQSGWGGYSNFFVELIVRTGLVGLLCLFIPIALAFAYFVRSLLFISSEILPQGSLMYVKGLAILCIRFLHCW